MSDEQRRIEVLTEWGKHPHPLVLAPQFRLGEWWLVRNDEFLTANQGSYRRMIATSYGGGQAIRGYQGVLVVLNAPRLEPPRHWWEVLEMVEHTPGITTWTEVLP